VKFCLGFTHDPGTFHANKKIVLPSDIKGMKIRPADATIAEMVTLLGGTNVQAAAPEVRDVLEKGVAEAVTFPWGSIPLFGIDKVVKYHMDAALYTTTFAWVINKAKYDGLAAGQRKVIDDHCTTDWALRIASPWAEFEYGGRAKLKAESGHEVYALTPAELAEWRKAAEPLQASWATKVRKIGLDPDTVLKELKADLAQYKAAY
jgi:TRAP-type C4-dicarboxylate transport system substrate-binding protein